VPLTAMGGNVKLRLPGFKAEATAALMLVNIATMHIPAHIDPGP
jgi:hypothetical protein